VIWWLACVTCLLIWIVAYQQYILRAESNRMRSLRQEQLIKSSDSITSPTPTTESSTWTTSDSPVAVALTWSTVSKCVTSYQALVDRIVSLWELSESDISQALNDSVWLGYCNGSTPTPQNFLTLTTNNQTISYDSTVSWWAIQVNARTIVPDFIKNCTTNCPTVQAIRTIDPLNKYVVLETTQPRSFQSSFRVISLTNGVTMMYWSALSFVDPMASYAWSKNDDFAFIASSGRDTYVYVVAPKWFPNATVLYDIQDSPIALTWIGDKLAVLYDRNPTNTDITDRYTQTYTIEDIRTQSTSSGTVQSN